VSQEDDAEEIIRIAGIISDANRHYSYPLTVIRFPDNFLESFKRTFNSLVQVSVPFVDLSQKLTNYFLVHPIHRLDDGSVEVYQAFVDSGLQDSVEIILADSVMAEIKSYGRKLYATVWDQSVLSAQKRWITSTLATSLQMLIGEAYNATPRMLDIAEDALSQLRIEELFDIVVDYPSSIPALKDLKACLKRGAQRAAAVNVFQVACSRRLLHGGANTVDIISGYISTIRSFSILDPKGVLLDKVSRPIRRYLKDRDDTIAVLVSGLLGEESSELQFLAKELAKSSERAEEPVDDLLDINWTPDPTDAPPDFMKELCSDLIGNLLSLYENKEVFVKELALVFANRMLIDPHSVDDVVCVMGFSNVGR
jgi:anaphase-promoting complex subunit 2